MNFKELNEKGISCILDLNRYGLSSFSIKIIAVLTMFIDHFAFIFLLGNEPLYTILRSVGRLSFPMFCFVLVEGYFHTRNRLQHAIRLGMFALVSEIPYNLMYGKILYLEKQNVMFTLFIGFMLIWGLDLIADYRVKYPANILRYIGIERLNIIIELVTIIVAFGFAYIINSSYAHNGVLLIMCFYVFKANHVGKVFCNIVFNVGMYLSSMTQWWGTISIIPIVMYNGKPGKNGGKYFFYWFYPVHLLVLVVIKHCLQK